MMWLRRSLCGDVLLEAADVYYGCKMCGAYNARGFAPPKADDATYGSQVPNEKALRSLL